MSEVAVVIPCYNEARRLDADAIRQHLAANPNTSFILVNDGSTDRTGEILFALEKELPRQIVVLALPRNQGKGEAVRQGVLTALANEAPFVGFWDADFATPLVEINRFREMFQEQPVLMLAMGARVRLLGRRIERSALRHYLGRVFASLASLALAMPVYDTQCGAKLFRVTPEVRIAFAEPFLSRWIFDVEILARLRQAIAERGMDIEKSICEVPLESWHNASGSKLRSWDAITAMWQLARIWFWRALRDHAPSQATPMRQP